MNWTWGWKRREDDLDSEIRTHLEMDAQDRIDRGESAQAAVAAARHNFGNAALVKDVTRDLWAGRWLRDLLHDAAYALRVLRKNAVVSAALVAIVALGIGAATAVFSISDAVMRKNDPNWYRRGAVIGRQPRRNARMFRFSIPEFGELARMNDLFESAGALRWANMALTGGDYPERVGCAQVSAEVIAMSTHPLILGRNFRPDETRPGGARVAVLSYEFWKSHFFSDPEAVGKSVRLDGLYYTVIGVAAPRESAFGSGIMLPLQADLATVDRAQRDLWVLVRLHPGVTWEQADGRLNAHAHAVERDYVSQYPEYAGLGLRFWNGFEANTQGIRPAMTVLLTAVGLLLVICCANIGGLLLARVAARGREFAVRAALGARRGRILRQMLTETLTLAAIGGATGVVTAYWCVPALIRLIPSNWSPVDPAQIAVNVKTLIFCTALTLATGVTFGVAPAWLASRGDPAVALREGGQKGSTGRRASWLRNALVVAQIALTLVVLVGATLAIESYRQSESVDLGSRPERVLTFQMQLPEAKYPGPREVGSFFDAVVRRLEALPGVEGAAFVSGLPMQDRTVDITTQDFTVDGAQQGGELATANYRLVSPGYFDVMGARLWRGRVFGEQDKPDSAPVAIVNATMARLYWPHVDAVGQKIHLAHPLSEGGGADLTIVGVVGDLKQVDIIDAPVRPEFFVAHRQFAGLGRGMSALVRSRLDAPELTAAVRRAVMSLDAEQPVYDVRSMEKVVSDSFGPQRITMVLLAFFAAVALPLAALGLYALIAYSVALRVRELGLRQALGARHGQILKLLMADGMRLAAAGILVGTAAGFTLARLMASQSYGVSGVNQLSNVNAANPTIFGGAALLIVAVALAACFIPARRALRLDPMAALRAE